MLTDDNGHAIYFSRAPVPYHRDQKFRPLKGLYRHIGVYGFRKPYLLKFLQWPAGEWESAECLEQLRVLQRGDRIRLVAAASVSPGVDVEADIAIVEQLIKGKGTDS